MTDHEKSSNPILNRLEKRGKQSKAYHASPHLEKGLAKKVRGYRTAGSGNKNEKGDVRVKGVTRIEHKATQHDSFRVTKEMLHKIESAAVACDEVPILVVEFVDARGKPTQGAIACMRLIDAIRIIHD